MHREVLGRVLGPAKGEGNEMAQWCLKANGNVVPRRTVRPLKASEISSETEQTKRKIFDDLIQTRHGTSLYKKSNVEEVEEDSDEPHEEYLDEYGDSDEPPRFIPEIDDPVDAVGNALNQ